MAKSRTASAIVWLCVFAALPLSVSAEPSYEGKLLSEWVQLLGDADEDAGIDAALAIAAIGAEAEPAVPDLAKALAGSTPSVRTAAASALGAIGPTAADAVPSLITALGDQDSAVRTYAAGALGAIGDKAITSADDLKQRLDDEDGDVRAQARWALRSIGAQDAASGTVAPKIDGKSLTDWIRQLRSDKALDRLDAAQSIGEMGPEAVAAAQVPLARALRDPDPIVRVAAIRTIGSIGPRAIPVMPAIVRALKDKDPSVRMYAAAAMGMIGPKASIASRRLAAAEKDDDADVRAAAGWARTKVPDRKPSPREEAQPPRPIEPEQEEDAAEPPPAREQPRAKRAPSAPSPPQPKLKPPPGGMTAEDWAEFANHRFPQVRQKAAKALGVMGADAKGAAPALEKAAADKDPEVAAEAGRALEQIRSASAPAPAPVAKTTPAKAKPKKKSGRRRPEDFKGLTISGPLKRRSGGRERKLREGESFSGNITVRLSKDGKMSGNMSLSLRLAAKGELDRDKSETISGPFEGEFEVEYNGHQAFEAHGKGRRVFQSAYYYAGEFVDNSSNEECSVNVFMDMIWNNGPVWEGKPLEVRGHARGIGFMLECPARTDSSPPNGVVEDDDEPEAPEAEYTVASPPPPPRPQEAEKQKKKDTLSTMWDTMWDDLAELDEQYSRDENWLISMTREFGEAHRAKAHARCQLRVMHDAAKNIQRHIDAIKRTLSKTIGAPSDDLLEDAWRAYMEDDKGLPDTRSPKTGLTMRQVLQKRVVSLQEELAAVRKEQDKLIKKTVERFTNLADELEAKGGKSKWKDIKAEALVSSKYVAERAPLVELELLLAAGQKDDFRNAARAMIDKGKFVEQVRLMEALHFADIKDSRATLKSTHLTLKHNPKNQEAQKMLERLELGYLMAIDRKTMGEAAVISKRCWKRLATHGDAGFWGYCKDVFTSGVGESMMALGGKHASLAKFSGTVQEEAARQHVGLTLICRLREAGLTLDQIKGLNNQQFIDVVKKSFPKFKGELPAKVVSRMRKAIHLAFQNTDVKRIASRSDLQLYVDTGKAYYNTDIIDLSLSERLGEMVCDGVNVKNVLIMAGPSAVVQAGGKAAGTGYWGFSGASAPKNLITAKEAFTSAIGLQGAVESLGKTKMGDRLIGQFVSYHKSTGFIGHRAVDMLVQIYATQAAGASGRGAAAFFRGGKKTQEKLGRAAELFAEVITAFGVGDYDVMAKAATQYKFNKAQADSIAGALKQALTHTKQTAVLYGKHMKQLDKAMEELASNARLTPGTKQAVAKSMTEIEGDLATLARKLATDDASPSVLQRYNSLRVAYQGLDAAQSQMPKRTKAWQSFAREIGEEVDARYNTLINQHKSCQAMGKSLQKTGASPTGTVIPGAKPGTGQKALRQIDWQPDFKKPGVVRAADDMLLQGKHKQAVRGYEDALAVYDEIGLGRTTAAKEISAKLDYAKRSLQGAQDIEFAKLGPKVNEGITDAITSKELNVVKQAALNPKSNIRFEKIGKGATEPYFVIEEAMENGRNVSRKLYVFKPDDPRLPLGGQAEEVFPAFAKDLDIDVPAARRATVMLNGKAVRGTFVRYAGGEELLGCDLGTRLALKKEIAKDWTLRAFFGDYDGHASNYLLAADGQLIPIDRNLSNMKEDNIRAIYDAIGLTELSDVPEVRAGQIKEIMKHRLKMMWTTKRPIYSAMVPVGNQMTYEDVADGIKKIQSWKRADIKAKIGTKFGADTEQVLDVLEARRDVMKEAFQEFLEKTPASAPIPGGVTLTPMPLSPLAVVGSCQELALAA